MRQLLLVAVVLVCAGICSAADKKVTVFNGKDFEGWKIINCQVEVQDGAMFIKDGNGVVRPDRTFKDFVLELEWKALKPDNWDSGVYFRCKDPDGTFPWPKRWQVNLRKGQEGDVAELKDARSKGLYKPGEWNALKLTVIGTKAELEINGKPAWKADGVSEPEGFISIQAEVPGGGQYLFRNIRITDVEK